MGELTDFLVWLVRENKAGKVSKKTLEVIGCAAFDYLYSQAKEPQFPQGFPLQKDRNVKENG